MNQLTHIPKVDEAFKMANLRRPFTKDKNTVGRVKPNGRCKKHPKHCQSPGVCSLCLREKLTQLSASSSRKTTSAVTAGSSCSSSSSSLSSYYSSSSASSCASPMHRFRFNKEGKSSSSVSIFLMNGKHGLIKSRSMTFVPRRRDGEGCVDHGHDKSTKKSGFWFKLLHPKSKRMEEKDTKLVHSRSIRETVTVAS